MTIVGHAQRWLYRQLEEPGRSRGLSPLNWLLVALILLSIALYTMNPEHDLDVGRTDVSWWVNRIVVFVFAVEFVARLWAAGADPRYRGPAGRLAWLRAAWFMVIVDLVAFAPELLFVLLGLPPPAWLRSLRVFRLFKLARYFQAFALIVDALRMSLQPLLAAIFAAALVWYLAGVALFLAERDAQPEVFTNIGDAMWLAIVTLATVGYGDIVPVTTAGRIIAGIVAVLGLGTVALPSGIIAGAFMQQIREREKRRASAPPEPPPSADG